MSDEIRAALTAVVERLVRLAAEEPPFRSHLLRLLDAVQAAVKDTEGRAEGGPAPDAPAKESSPPEPPSSISPALGEEEPATPSPALPMTSDVLLPPVEASAPAADARETWLPPCEPATGADLGGVEERCRLKVEASRWAARRRCLTAAGAPFRTDIGPRDEEMIERGRAANCYLWMCNPYGPSPDDPSGYDLVAGCFEATAEAVALVRLVLEVEDAPRRELEASLHLLAEAQSGLRVAADALGGQEDEDQQRVFQWLKRATWEMQVYVPRHMRRDDPANPSGSANLVERVRAAREKVEQARTLKRQRKKLLGKIRHKLSLLPDAPEAERVELWQALAAAVDQLVTGGLPPSNKHLREHLLPALGGMPELPDVPKGFQLFLREMDRYREGVLPPEAPASEDEPPAEVRRASRLLAGRAVVLIGGDPRPGAKESLERAFGLRELVWVGTREHQSITEFEPFVARPEVALVLLAIRWSSHSYAEVQKFCDRYGKPLVRLPGGYNPNQVAAQILTQCSDRLAST
jgi:hypothetical protein